MKRTYKQFIQAINEKTGDFGSVAPKPKENCYGRKIRYAGLKRKVCAFKRKRE